MKLLGRSLCIATLSFGLHAAADALPEIGRFSDDALLKTEVIWALDHTLPVYVQRRFAPERPLDVAAYAKGAYSVVPLPVIAGLNARRAQDALVHPRSEFEAARAAQEFSPYVEQIGEWAHRASYVLVPTKAAIGEYDFSARTFPIRLQLINGPLNTPAGEQPVTCLGAMWRSGAATHRPCLRVLGIGASPAAFTSLRVDDLNLAQRMKESQGGNAFVYWVLAKPVGPVLQSIPRAGPWREDVAHVLTLEPLGLYVHERSSGAVAMTAALTPEPRRAAPSATSGTNSRPAAGARSAAPRAQAASERAAVRNTIRIVD